jgi:prepilin-type N-terminal cleavage/methylation domain-containing protein
MRFRNFLKKIHQHQESGFTLVEVLVAVFLFSVVLTSTSYALNTNLSNAILVKNNFLASGFAQEGVEIMRNLRDEDWFASRPFGSFGGVGALPDGDYRVQWDSTVPVPIIGADVPLRKDSGFYGYGSGNNTIFFRRITVTTITPDVEKRIVVTITWKEKKLDKSLSAEEHLFNWK